MKGIYSPISYEYSQELRALVDEMLSQNSKNRPSIFEILTRPFLFGKVKNYIKRIYKNREKYENEVIESLVEQAKSLRIGLEEPKGKLGDKGEGTPRGNKMAKVETRNERNRSKML
jgi:serine/threonine protein kinase